MCSSGESEDAGLNRESLSPVAFYEERNTGAQPQTAVIVITMAMLMLNCCCLAGGDQDCQARTSHSRQMTGNGNRRAPIVVAVDLDEVLGEFVSTLAKYHNAIFGTTLSVSDFFSYDFVDVWGGTREEANEKVFAFFASPQFKDHLPPIAEALEVLTLFKKRGNVEFHLVTSRQHIIQADTERWIEQHYAGIFTDMHFGNHYSSEGTVRSKPDMCRAIGAQLLVDDSLKYALQVAHECKIPVLLFGDYPWNQTPESIPLPPLVTRVLGWDCVRRNLESMLDGNGAKSVDSGCQCERSSGRAGEAKPDT